MLKRLLMVVGLGLVGTRILAAPDDADASLLQTLRTGHPRLLVLDDQLTAVKEMLKTNAEAQAAYGRLQAEGEKILSEPPLTYEIGGVEHTLLGVSRQVEGRVWLLAGLYRLNGDARLAARARDEMLAAAGFPDWYPKHFLDTGEMTAALGVGYDWLYDFLSPSDRATIQQAIVAKGLNPGIAGLTGKGHLRNLHNNWVQVCNGGLTIGALAIADEEPAKAAQIIKLAQPQMKRIMGLFAPDGGFEEGPIYWNYATAYNVYYLAALESALGTDFGLSQARGFDLTGNYRIQTIGPAGKCANFGDASEDISIAPQMLWLARKFNHPEYAWHEEEINELLSRLAKRSEFSRFAIMELLWAQPGGDGLSTANLSAGAKFDRIAAAFLRTDWGDTNAIYIGFKGGSSRASHGHLDLGSYVLDAFGQRWAVDLGPDSYGLPGYFGKQRWTYYRMRTEGHNTLTIDGQNESLTAVAPLTAFSTGDNRSFAIADLSAAYRGQLAAWQRGVLLLNRRQVLVQDEVQPKQAADIVWNFHTRARITLADDGRQAVLSQGGARLSVRILSPAGTKFEDQPVTIPAPQRPAPGVENLMIRLPQTPAKTTIAVLFQAPDDPAVAPELQPLASWSH